jgi:hypothetical protein
VALPRRPARPADGVSVEPLSLQDLIVFSTSQGDRK